MEESYVYRCKDQSILAPLIKKHFAEPLATLLPSAIPANFVTLTGNILLYFCLFRSIVQAEYKSNFLLIPLCIFLYLILDQVDGLQAQKTNTSSPLGEFIDHFSDIFNTGIILFIVFIFLDPDSLILIAFMFYFIFTAHALTFFEQYKTGWLIFERITSFEGAFLLIVLLMACGVESLGQLLIVPFYQQWSFVEIIILLSMIGIIPTFVSIRKRIGHITLKFYIFSVGYLIVCLYSWITFSPLIAFVVCTFYSALYIGSLMKARFHRSPEPFGDVVVPSAFLLLLVVGSMVGPDVVRCAHVMLLLYLGIRVVSIAASTVYRLRAFWVWKNPGYSGGSSR